MTGDGLPTLAILAGGLATRLRPLTETIPKSLVDVAGEPFIARQLRLFQAAGAHRVVILAGYLGEMIEAVVGDGSAYGLAVEYVYDGKRLLGTAGALRRALPRLGDEFLVVYGDSYLPCDYAAALTAFRAGGKPALMTVFHNEGLFDTSNVEYAAGRILAYDKKHRTDRMRHIDYGLGIFKAEAFAGLAEGVPVDLADLYGDLLARDALAGHEVFERFYEVGSFPGLRELQRYFKGDAMDTDFTRLYLAEARRIIDELDVAAVEAMARLLADVRERGGRLFILGVGGGSANAAHAVNDFRKIVGLEAYAPTDNVSELTARTNDEGWASVFEAWLKTSRLSAKDAVFVFSVGGGDLENNVSPNLVAALTFAKSVGAAICGVVGRDGGFTARCADACVVIPTVNPVHVTPHTEAFQAVVWHLLVSHPLLKQGQTKWESIK